MVGKHGNFHEIEYNREFQNLPDKRKNWYNPAAITIATIAQPVEQTFRKRQVKSSNLFGGSPEINEILLSPLNALINRAMLFNIQAEL